MVWPQFATRDGRLAGLLGALVCLVTIPFVPVGMSILCAAVAVLVGVPERASERGVSWKLVIVLGLGAYAFKVLGLVVIGARSPAAGRRALPGA